MSMFFEDHKNIFEILKEDDGSDIINGGDAAAGDADSTVDNGGGDADASSTTDNNDSSDDSSGDDDNFDIDTSLGDEDGDSGDDSSGGDDSSSDLDSDDSSSSSGGGSEDEAIPANKDVFTTLTAEEQAIKIKEQKKQFNNMYIYIDDLIDKVSDIKLDEDTAVVIERISKRLYELREYLNEYITTIYASKDYITNDIFYNRFLQVLYSIDTTMEEIATSRAKKMGLELDESDKK